MEGVEVSRTADLPNEFSVVSIPAQKHAVFSHQGHVSELHKTCEAIFGEWLPASGYEVARERREAPDFLERYGEGFDPRTGIGETEVLIAIKDRNEK